MKSRREELVESIQFRNFVVPAICLALCRLLLEMEYSVDRTVWISSSIVEKDMALKTSAGVSPEALSPLWGSGICGILDWSCRGWTGTMGNCGCEEGTHHPFAYGADGAGSKCCCDGGKPGPGICGAGGLRQSSS